jgi:hypothetical protein
MGSTTNILNQRINYNIEDITDRADKENLVQYVTKQSRDNHFLTHVTSTTK